MSALNERCIACDGPVGSPSSLGPMLLARCASCGSATALPRPTEETLVLLHDSQEYTERPYFEHRRGNAKSIARRLDHLRKIFDTYDPAALTPGSHVLDVGCDTGDLLVAAAERLKVEPFGIEIAQRAAAVAASKGVHVTNSALHDAPKDLNGFALITMIDVVEHVDNPLEFVQDASKRLAPGGHLYLETPNWSSSVYALGRVMSPTLHNRPTALFERLFLPEHVQYFTVAGMKALATRAGMQVEAHGFHGLQSDPGSMLLRAALRAVGFIDWIERRGLVMWALFKRGQIT